VDFALIRGAYCCPRGVYKLETKIINPSFLLERIGIGGNPRTLNKGRAILFKILRFLYVNIDAVL